MEWSWRTVLILIGLVVMAAILVDGFRRMRRARAEALRLDVSNDFKFPDDGHNPELPGGSFRVVGQHKKQPAGSDGDDIAQADAPTAEEAAVATDAPYREPEFDMPAFSAGDDLPAGEPVIPWEDEVSPARVISAQQAEAHQHEPEAEKVHDLDIPPSPLIPRARPVNLDESFPVLLDVEELGADDAEPDVAYSAGDDSDTVPDEDDAELAAEALAAGAEDGDVYDAADEDDYPADPHLDNEVDDIPPELPLQPVNYAGPGAEVLSSRPVPELVLEIHCIARDPAGFPGKDILFLFNSCDLRFGEKNIFHRFEQPDGMGRIQFSVAQSFEPGVFVPAAMAQQHFRGLSFFMSLPGAEKPREAYDAMSEMALVVARKLHADLFDGARSALTPQTMEHERQQIMDFERRQKLALKKQARH